MRFRTGDDRNERVPSGGWRAYLAETDTEFGPTIGHWSDLKRKIVRHVRSNPGRFDVADEDLEAWAEDLLCQQNMVGVSHCDGTEAPHVGSVKIRIGDVLTFLTKMAKHVAKGFDLVEQEEAERRAAICAQCPKNREVSGCLFCQHLFEEVMEKIEKRKTRLDHRLKSCLGCKCILKAMVWYPPKVLRDTSPADAQYAEGCWKKEIVENDQADTSK